MHRQSFLELALRLSLAVTLCRASPRSLLAVTELLLIFAFPKRPVSGDAFAFEYQPRGPFWDQDYYNLTDTVGAASSSQQALASKCIESPEFGFSGSSDGARSDLSPFFIALIQQEFNE
jgi:hypothetical protein